MAEVSDRRAVAGIPQERIPMVASTRWLLIPALLTAWLRPTGPAVAFTAAAPASASGVRDRASMFPADAVRKADEKIRDIRNTYRKDLLIETVPGIPEDQQKRLKDLGKKQFFLDWAKDRADNAGVKGIYVLICKSPGHIEVLADRETRVKAFPSSARDKLFQILRDRFDDKKFGDGLIAGVDFVASTLNKTI